LEVHGCGGVTASLSFEYGNVVGFR
jgi:hypothetical protein